MKVGWPRRAPISPGAVPSTGYASADINEPPKAPAVFRRTPAAVLLLFMHSLDGLRELPALDLLHSEEKTTIGELAHFARKVRVGVHVRRVRVRVQLCYGGASASRGASSGP